MTFWHHMLTQEVDRKPFSGLDDDASPTYGSTETGLDARVERGITESHGGDGTVEDTVTTVRLKDEVSEGDILVLPSGDDMKVSNVESHPSTDGRTTLYTAEG